MSETTCLHVKNWETFQHFKDRRPPWIKLYRDLLDDPEWHLLDAKSAKVLIMLWLVASDDKTGKGLLPDLRHLSFRLRMDESTLSACISKLSHWVISDDIAPISRRYRDDAPEERREEAEIEGEIEVEEEVNRSSDSPAPHPELFPDVVKAQLPTPPKTNEPEAVRLAWNVIAAACGLKPCRKLSSGRMKSVRERLRDPDWSAHYPEALERLKGIRWIRGGPKFGPRPIDWFLQPDTLTKILEGSCDDNRKRVGETHNDDDYQPF